MKRFRVSLQPCLCRSQSHQSGEEIFGEPSLGTLRAEDAHQEHQLAADDVPAERYEHVRVAEIAFVLRDFVFEHRVITKGVPRELGQAPMILVPVLEPVSEYEIR